MSHFLLWADVRPPTPLERVQEFPTWMLAAAGLSVLLVVLLLARLLFRKKPVPVDVEANLREDLTEYPPAPGRPGPRRLEVDGLPARLRLVVVAPVGRDTNINGDAIEGLLDQVLRGLGAQAQQDRPRIRVWPSQLSNRGFAPTFHRLVHKPEADGQLSNWALVAGQAKAGRWPLLLGLALWTDQPSTLGKQVVEADRWRDLLRIRGANE